MLMLHFLLSFAQILFFFEFLLEFLQHPLRIFQSLLISLSFYYPPIMFSPLFIYLQSYLFHKWIFLELVALLYLYAFKNLPLTQVCYLLLLLLLLL